jgi:hypothetical protein
MVAGAGETGRDEHRANLVAVQARCMGLVVQTWAANVHGWRGRDESFLFGVAVERGDRAQPTGNRGPRPSESLEVPSERLDIAAACTEHCDSLFGAPGDVLA